MRVDVYEDTITSELGACRSRGLLEFFDENGQPYDSALLVRGTPSEERYKFVKSVKSVEEFLKFRSLN